MKKHLILCFLAIFTGIFPSKGINKYQEGDTLFVWAKSGLILRAAPDFKAEKIGTLPYGTAVKTLGSKFRQNITETEIAVIQPYHFNGKNYAGYKIPGRWVQVTVKGKTGYVFDGYLSGYPPVTPGLQSQRDEWDAYLSHVFGTSGISIDTNKSRQVPKYDIVFYKNGASRQSRGAGDGLTYQTYILPELSLEEGFLLANYFYNLEKNSNRPVKTDEQEDAPYMLMESSPCLLHFNSDSGFMGRISIGCVNGVVVITTFFSC